ncbi:MAG TPA: deaminase [Solirubrobacteraceae bacterium]|nr:deaminase [Solirubrobacteraceae bacterium]
MSRALLAYVPVLHEGYRRFLAEHGAGLPLYLIGPELYAENRALAKDIRALPAEAAASAIAAWRICLSVAVLDVAGAERLAAEGPSLVAPAEDVSYAVVERWFGRCEVRYASVFLRWDKTRTVMMLEPEAAPAWEGDADLRELAAAAEREAAGSVDWWRRVGAAIRFADGHVEAARNEHLPHPLAPYAAGDPRANFYKGVALELSTAQHAEARLIAAAAREGRSTEGAAMYVTDFPCPPCAKLIAAAGVSRIYFRTGYAVLDGQDVLREAGVEVLQVA